MSVDLREGRWQDVLADVTCDALIVDAPYSARTHKGHDSAASSLEDRASLNYAAWTYREVGEFVEHWHPRTRGWFVTLTDHELARDWEEALRMTGRLVFSPLAFVAPGSRVRAQGDGPAQWAVSIVVARPRGEPFSKWGSLPGAYVLPPGMGEMRGSTVTGGKPLWLMQALVRDYSRAGDLVCDPCAGGGTTLLAAAIEGRRAVGAEALPEHYAKATKRLARGYTPTLFG